MSLVELWKVRLKAGKILAGKSAEGCDDLLPGGLTCVDPPDGMNQQLQRLSCGERWRLEWIAVHPGAARIRDVRNTIFGYVTVDCSQYWKPIQVNGLEVPGAVNTDYVRDGVGFKK